MIREIKALWEMGQLRNRSRDELLNYQNRQLRSLIHHAYENVPHYRRLFDRNHLQPADIRGADDLIHVPITTKEHFESRPAEDFIARGVDPKTLIVRESSGSTGHPKLIRRTWWEERLLNAFRFRALSWFGMRATDHVVSLIMARSPQTPDNQSMSNMLQSIGLFRATVVDCRLPLKEILPKLEALRPDVLYGYASMVAAVAVAIGESGRRTLRPRLVATGGEVQTPLMREQIARAFGAPVYNVYGAHEFNLVGWECAKTGRIHTTGDLAVVEVLRPDGRRAAEGESGELIGTNLHAYAMPLIRYRLGDVVTRGTDSCACGLPVSTISAVQGRTVDYFHLANGRSLHPYEILYTVLHDRATWVRQYQLTQERSDSVVLSVEARVMPSDERLNEIRRHSEKILGPGIRFQIQFVEQIPIEANGKFRVARSMVNLSDETGKTRNN